MFLYISCKKKTILKFDCKFYLNCSNYILCKYGLLDVTDAGNEKLNNKLSTS